MQTSSKYIGVSRVNHGKKRWEVTFKCPNGQSLRERFVREIDAAKRRDALARQHHGEFAALNFE